MFRFSINVAENFARRTSSAVSFTSLRKRRGVRARATTRGSWDSVGRCSTKNAWQIRPTLESRLTNSVAHLEPKSYLLARCILDLPCGCQPLKHQSCNMVRLRNTHHMNEHVFHKHSDCDAYQLSNTILEQRGISFRTVLANDMATRSGDTYVYKRCISLRAIASRSTT